MEKIKAISSAAAVLTLSLTMAFPSQAAKVCPVGTWEKAGDTWRYIFKEYDGCASNGVYKIGGAYYFFDSGGKMMTGWLNISDYFTFYADETGALAEGWRLINDKWYYFDVKGRIECELHYGRLEVDGKVYFMGSDGSMQTGTFETYDGWFTADPETGELIRDKMGVIETTGKEIRYDSEGRMCIWNETNGDWEPVMTSSVYCRDMMSLLRQEYREGKYETESQFEIVVRERLAGNLDENKINGFLRDTINQKEGSK